MWLHSPRNRDAATEEGCDVQGEDLVPLIVGHVECIRVKTGSRVVDQNVDSAEFVSGPIDGALQLGLDGDLCLEGFPRDALPRQAVESGAVSIRVPRYKDHVCPGLRDRS